MTISIRTISALLATVLASASLQADSDSAQTSLDDLYSEALSTLHSQGENASEVLTVENEAGRQLSVVTPANLTDAQIARLIEREAFVLRF
ncbi:hypothetical protein ACTXK7_06920 [Vreelandella alkaliphila]|uniref:Uncharacterized protein n=1 Tax=Halomonas campaniensis TaxID=213554 RepID=A0A3D0KGV7_9GAMM|nr:hypothetical protein [Halomonas sp. 3F2F]HCA02807.1 hypothetical protein [Halomonas campaniensis]